MRPEKMAPEEEKKSVEKKILTVLARKGESWRYDLNVKEQVASRPAIDDALKRLVKKELIRISRTEKRGSTKTVYELTISGLFVALTIEDTWRNIDQVQEKQQHMLPLIFGKWRHFIKHGVKDRVVNELKNYIFNCEELCLREWKPLGKSVESYMCEGLTRHILLHMHALHLILPDEHQPSKFFDEQKEWIKVLGSDPDLKSYFSKYLDQLKTSVNILSAVEYCRSLIGEKKNSHVENK